ncbi:MAG TPA: hypothetical protein VEG64_01010 [Candidatus Sulfotelmatobacter sp.]|nr:hypothetical protein [Candidatus Sulfotelmatobacter sp.]
MLPTRQLIPPLTLRAPEGKTIRSGDFKQKKNLFIAFLDVDCAPCDEFLAEVARRAGELRERQAVALIAFLAPVPLPIAGRLPAEIIAGSDISGRGAQAFLGDDAFFSNSFVRTGVFLADRYGELFAQWSVVRHKFPPMDELFRWLDQIEIACEECGASESAAAWQRPPDEAK